MSDDKLSQEEMREDIKNLISWGHAHDYDAIIQEVRADVWDEALEYALTGTWSPAYNPYRDQEEA